MKELEKKILEDGKVYPGDILKIDNFLNHQIDINFLDKIGSEFARLFSNEKIDKIITIEASGIAIAVSTAQHLNNVPVIFAKKIAAANMNDDTYRAPCYSYTRKKQFYISVAKEYLHDNSNILIIDDFLANGQALEALINILNQAHCNIVGCGVVVEKAYQPGGNSIRNKGYRVESLAKIASMSDNSLSFKD